LQAAQQREEERLKLSSSQDQAARLGQGFYLLFHKLLHANFHENHVHFCCEKSCSQHQVRRIATHFHELKKRNHFVWDNLFLKAVPQS
jgi:hypothetical protein